MITRLLSVILLQLLLVYQQNVTPGKKFKFQKFLFTIHVTF